jgi:hypothetical protein
LKNGTGSIINSPDEVGGWPVLAKKRINHTNIPSNPHADSDKDGYTNLEEWLHLHSEKVEKINYGKGKGISVVTGFRIKNAGS